MRNLAIILGMAGVTYLPRLLPALFMGRVNFPPWFQKWLRSVPYAVLGALIFPGVLLVDRDQPWLGLAGGLTAVGLSFLNLPLTLVMAGSITAVFLLQLLV